MQLGTDLTLGLERWNDLKDQDVTEPSEKEKVEVEGINRSMFSL